METTTVERDLPCVICGYNLKGLATDANCPECGQAISRTYYPDIRQSTAQWLHRQALGMFFLAPLVLTNYFGMGSIYGRGPDVMRFIFDVLVCGSVTVGVFLLSAPELPASATGVWFDPWRRGIRSAAVTLFAIRLSSFIPSILDSRLWNLLLIVAVLALLALNFLTARFLHRLAARCADRALTAHARIVFWTLPLQFAAYFCWSFFLRGIGDPEVRFYVATIFGWLNAAVELTYLLLLGRLHERMRLAGADSVCPS